MRRADRLFQIVQYLRGGRLVTAAQLAERLEVSERTIYRDIADLVGTGVPIEGEAGVGYVMRSGYDLPPLMFNRDELVALVAGARMVREWGGATMAQAAEEALVKIDAVLPESARTAVESVAIFAKNPEKLGDDTRILIDRLERFAQTRTALIITYEDTNGAPSQRRIRPLGLWFWGKVWTLVSWCELRDDFRMFRIDRLADVIEDGSFPVEPTKSLKAFYADQRRRYGK
ncbi:MAG: YafY family protein [Pseudoruegeria sp.]